MLCIPLGLEKASEGLYLWRGTGPVMLPTALDCVNKLYSIDRWTEPHHDIQEYQRAMNRLEAFGVRSRVMRASFAEALGLFVDGCLDFVYVDGYAHTGQEDGQTLRDWWPKVKPGGVLAGHDYHPRFQPTMDAVDAFVREHGLELHLTTEEELPSWWVVKGEEKVK